MFENYIEIQTRKLEGLFDQTSVPIEQIIYNNSIPNYFVNYLRAYINSKSISLYLDLIENYNFSKDSMELAEAWRVFDDTYRNSFEFSSELLQSLIYQSTTLYFNYLVRPQTTLVNFIFQDYLFQSIQNIKERLKYFQDTDYLISRLTLWLEEQEFDNNLQKINKFQFKKVISNIENEYYKDFESSEINHWFELINNFINFESNNKSIDTSFFAIFFDDKKWFGLKDYIIHHFLDKSMTKIDINDVVELINHYLSDALLIEKEKISEEPIFTKIVEHTPENNDGFENTNDQANTNDQFDAIIDENFEYNDNSHSEIRPEDINFEDISLEEINSEVTEKSETDETTYLETDSTDVIETFTQEVAYHEDEFVGEIADTNEEVLEPNELEATDTQEEINEAELSNMMETNDETQETLEHNSTTETEDEIDFDLLADMIASGNDQVATSPIAPNNNQNKPMQTTNENTDNLIEMKLSKLESQIQNLDLPNYKPLEEINEDNFHINMDKLDVENLKNNSIKKDLLELMLKLKKK